MTAPVLDDDDYDKLYDLGAAWDVAAWAVAGYHKDGDHFHAYDSEAWTYPLSTEDAALVWRTLTAIARAGDGAGTQAPPLEAVDLLTVKGRVYLGGIYLPYLWKQLQEWRRVRSAQATTPTTASSGGMGWLFLLALAALSKRSNRRR